MPTNTKRRKRQRLEVVLFIVLAVAIVAGLSWYAERRYSPYRVPVTFQRLDGSFSPQVFVEIASTPTERREGLMFRKPAELGRDQGMLFIFPTMEQQSFWMKNTYIPLDMLFLDSDRRIVGILPNRPILNKEQQAVDAESQYVLELHAGYAEQLELTVGALMIVQGQIPDPV